MLETVSLDDIWINNQRYVILSNYDVKGNEIYIAKIRATVRADRVKNE
jgi:hypothetical protein